MLHCSKHSIAPFEGGCLRYKLPWGRYRVHPILFPRTATVFEVKKEEIATTIFAISSISKYDLYLQYRVEFSR